MKLTSPDDPRLDYVYPGVMQNADGQLYRQGAFKDGSVAFVEAVESRKIEYVPGSMAHKTDSIRITDVEGQVTYLR